MSSGEGVDMWRAEEAEAEVMRPAAASDPSALRRAGRRLATAPPEGEPDHTRRRRDPRGDSSRGTDRLGGSSEPPGTTAAGAGPDIPDHFAVFLEEIAAPLDWLWLDPPATTRGDAGPEVPDSIDTFLADLDAAWLSHESSAALQQSPVPAPAPATPVTVPGVFLSLVATHGAGDDFTPEVGLGGGAFSSSHRASSQCVQGHGGYDRLGPGVEGSVAGHVDLESRGHETAEGDSLLPRDILAEIFSRLETRALCSVAQVCRHWRRESTQPQLWQHLDLRGFAIRFDAFAALCERQGQIQSLNLQGCRFRPEELERLGPSALLHLPRLRELSLGPCKYSFPKSFISGLAMHCPALQVLRVSRVNTGYRRNQRGVEGQLLEISHPQLVEVELSDCTLSGVSVRCPALLAFSCRIRQPVRVLNLTCPQLRTLDLSRCRRLSAHCLQQAILSCTALTDLNIGGCYNFSDDCMRAVGQQCTQLTTLDASDGLDLTLVGMGTWPSLRTLTLCKCIGLSRVSRQMLASFPQLTALHLDWAPRLTEVDVALEFLRELSLSNCINLAGLAVRCRNLMDLRLRDCTGLTNVVVQAARLASISFRGCSQMKSLTLQCSALKSLSLEDCNNLEQAELAHVRLTSLNLGLCPRLSELTLASTSLESLELQGCSALSTLHLACPNLTSLDARYCIQLTDACLPQLATCTRLSSLDLSHTYVTSLAPIFLSCSQLRVLKVTRKHCNWL